MDTMRVWGGEGDQIWASIGRKGKDPESMMRSMCYFRTPGGKEATSDRRDRGGRGGAAGGDDEGGFV